MHVHLRRPIIRASLHQILDPPQLIEKRTRLNRGWITLSIRKNDTPDWTAIYRTIGDPPFQQLGQLRLFFELQFVVEAEGKDKKQQN